MGVLHSQSMTPESSGRSIHPLPPQSLQLRRRSAAAVRAAFSAISAWSSCAFSASLTRLQPRQFSSSGFP